MHHLVDFLVVVLAKRAACSSQALDHASSDGVLACGFDRVQVRRDIVYDVVSKGKKEVTRFPPALPSDLV